MGDDHWYDCVSKGCRWSVIYKLCGVTLLLIAANSFLQCCGATSHVFRGLSSCCGSLLCCTNFAAIITTAVFRFNAFGMLAAESLVPTEYNGDSFQMTGSRYTEFTVPTGGKTYHEVGKWIIGLWVFQILFCCCHCGMMGDQHKPTQSHASAVRRNMDIKEYDQLTDHTAQGPTLIIQTQQQQPMMVQQPQAVYYVQGNQMY